MSEHQYTTLNRNNILSLYGHITYPVGSGDFNYHVHGFGAEEPAVAADHQGAAGSRRLDGAEHGLHEVLRVVGLLEYFDGLAQAAGSGLLAFVRLGLH